MKDVVRMGILPAILLLVPWSGLVAAPLPPRLVVNHETRQCGEFFVGDECMDCFPPAGWEVLGVTSAVSCPEGYTDVGRIDSHRQPLKASFCCSEGHSGAPGDCEDLVINRRAKQCVFVEDIETCRLPTGWTRRPENVQTTNWVCPASYEWIEALACESGPGGTDPHPRSGDRPFESALSRCSPDRLDGRGGAVVEKIADL